MLTPPQEPFLKLEPFESCIDPSVITGPLSPPYTNEPVKMYKGKQRALSPEDDDHGFTAFSAKMDAEGDVDEDTKLLMSEEGKKLSSKERRQLRNKVSARNFRVRRKEYITHLETLVNERSFETSSLRRQVDSLRYENDELTRELNRLRVSLSPSSIAASTPVLSPAPAPLLIPQMAKDINPYSTNASFEDWPLSYLNSTHTANDFNMSAYTSVFGVRSAPEPIISEKELMGKDGTDRPYFSAASSNDAFDCVLAFNSVMSSILGYNWNAVPELADVAVTRPREV